ncbi:MULTISPECIES: hypothetical protein [Oceanospirillaceae]|uniref:hypothetical protein n=1 Tax=Oceanospirillaceae TaxID=135620 RepID=UPI00119756E2|nr:MULTISPECIES: hypothetical protein [Thalassolituus]MBU2038402.1 hypothetical protein [Gammaproteobacteria bacterium]MCB2387097.1 hypothetical protein [Thalassolituus alkanivorans]MCB2421457.1 hypothetical protein [Thalassolituus alkanivorans]TVV44638.1 hypothetical protein FOT50_05610 [Thalassolituus sp. C2-1]
MRAATLAIAATLLVGCIAEEDKDKITNEQGVTVSDPTLALNGLWDGQFDQAGSLRVLIYNGNVYGLDESRGYYGTALLNNDNRTATLALTGYTLSQNDTAAKQYVADGLNQDYSLNGLLYTVEASPQLVGDFENATGTGSFVLTDDGTWPNNSALSLLAGKWTATGYEFYVEPLSSKASFKGISTDSSGCTFEGDITLLDKNDALYAVTLRERKNCPAFNETNASGYAVINSDGSLELYLRKDTDLLFMTFTAPVSSTPVETPTDTTDTTTDTTTL